MATEVKKKENFTLFNRIAPALCHPALEWNDQHSHSVSLMYWTLLLPQWDKLIEFFLSFLIVIDINVAAWEPKSFPHTENVKLSLSLTHSLAHRSSLTSCLLESILHHHHLPPLLSLPVILPHPVDNSRCVTNPVKIVLRKKCEGSRKNVTWPLGNMRDPFMA